MKEVVCSSRIWAGSTRPGRFTLWGRNCDARCTHKKGVSMGSDGTSDRLEPDEAPALGGRWASVVAYVLLGGLIVLVLRPAETSSYNIGRSLGVALISVVISYGIWSLVRRSRGSGERWSPWILLIAIFVATFLKLVSQGDARPTDGATAGTTTRSVATLSAEDVFVNLDGLRYESIPPETLEQMEKMFLSDPAAADALLSVNGRLVFEGRRQVGVIAVVFSTPEAAAAADFQAGFFNGFKESVQEQGGGPIESQQLNGVEVQGGPTKLGYTMSFTLENAAIIVLGGDRETALMIANGLLKSQR